MNDQLVIQVPNPRLEIFASFLEGEVVLLTRPGHCDIGHLEETWVIVYGVVEELKILGSEALQALSVGCRKRRLR